MVWRMDNTKKRKWKTNKHRYMDKNIKGKIGKHTIKSHTIINTNKYMRNYTSN